MTEHSLTNKKLFKKFWDYTVDADLMGQVFYTPDGMRAAYNRGRNHQLKQVIEWLNETISERGSSLEAVNIPEELRGAMRPTTTQEENQ